MTAQFDPRADDLDDELQEYVRERVNDVGIDYAFSRLDAMAADDPPAETTEYGFDVPTSDGPETVAEKVEWFTKLMCDSVGADALSSIDEADVRTEDTIGPAPGMRVLVLSSMGDGHAVLIPPGAEIDVVLDRSIPADKALCARPEDLGFAVVEKRVTVDRRENDDGVEVMSVRHDRGYTVENPDAAYWIDVE